MFAAGGDSTLTLRECKAGVDGSWLKGGGDRGRKREGDREREREREREGTGYEPFAVHAPTQWAI